MRLIFTLLLFCCTLTLTAQQAPQYSMYMLNIYRFNPAYAGLDNSLSATGVFRKQWVDIPGSPTQQNLNVHMPLYILRGGFGIDVENENLGAERNTSATLSYNYWIPLNKKSLLTMGIGAGVVQKALDGSKLVAPDGIYQGTTFTHNDGNLPTGMATAIAPTLSAGVYYQSEIFEVGLSANNLLGTSITYEEIDLTNIILDRNYFLTFALNLELTSTLTVHPSFFAKSDIDQTQMEISTLLRYNDNIFGGASFRGYNAESIDAVVLIGGFKLNEKVTLAYSYDLSLSAVNSVTSGSHEILLNYNLNRPFGAGVPPKIIYNPRFL
ncbi:MAG: type IX secretion system membrane protein PorP/SprF [Bacteroidota bacterium]